MAEKHISIRRWSKSATAVVVATAALTVGGSFVARTSASAADAVWPQSAEVAEFDASKSELAIETLEIVHLAPPKR